jgi:hypothetical protein
MSKKVEPTQSEIEAAQKIDVQAATLVGTVRDDVLSIFKNHGDWKKIPEAKQRDIAHAAEQLSKDLVRKVSRIIAGRGFASIHGNLQAINVKDGLKLTISASKSVECRRELMDHQGGSVTIVLADISPYMMERSEPDIDVDEPLLPIVEKPVKSKKR